jgi:DNA-binding transcriptional regulator GbsR (MarR family)
MIATPVLTAHKVKDALDCSFPSASAALKKMEDLGILIRLKKYRRNRVFVAKEIIDILNRPREEKKHGSN